MHNKLHFCQRVAGAYQDPTGWSDLVVEVDDESGDVRYIFMYGLVELPPIIYNESQWYLLVTGLDYNVKDILHILSQRVKELLFERYWITE